MKNFRKKAAPAFVLLAGATMSLAGVTYAWFNGNQQVQIGNMKVGVTKESGGISISKDGTNFANSFDLGDVDYGQIVPVSTTYEIQGTAPECSLNFYKATIDPSDTTKLVSSAAADDGNYIKLDFYVENVSGEEKDVYFTNSNLSKLFATETVSAYSSRIGFLWQGYAEDKTGPYHLNSSTDADAKGKAASIVVLEPYAEKHVNGAIVKGTKNQVGKEGDENYAAAVADQYYAYGTSGYKCDDRQSYVGVCGTWSESIKADTAASGKLAAVTPKLLDDCKTPEAVAATPAVKYTAEEVATHNAKPENSENPISTEMDKTPAVAAHYESKTPLFHLMKGYNKITLFVWLEGQDCDCISAASGIDFELDFDFNTKLPDLPTTTA